MAKKEVKKKLTWWDIVKIIFKTISIGFSILMFVIFLIFFASMITLIAGTEDFKLGNIAVIPIKGVITMSDSDTLMMRGTKSPDIVKFIQKAEDADHIKAIVLDIDSSGGAPVASDDIAQAVKKAEKPVIAVIGETGASGAFWIATAADKIYANRMSVTGSIGVRGSYLEWAGLMEDYNVTYRRLVAGKYKDTGSPFKTMTPNEERLFQNLLDDLHDEFITAVAHNRNLSIEEVRDAANGFIFLGAKAKELGFIDELGSKEDAIAYLEKKLNITAEPVEYKKKATLGDLLGQVSAENFYNIGKGIGTALRSEPTPSFA